MWHFFSTDFATIIYLLGANRHPLVGIRFNGYSSVLFNDMVDFQADIGLGLRLVSVIRQCVSKPFRTRDFNSIEDMYPQAVLPGLNNNVKYCKHSYSIQKPVD